MSNVTIALKKPISAHGRRIERIVLREPSTLECLRLGDPYTVAQTQEGIKFFAENAEAIEGYLKLCIVEPEDPMVVLTAPRPDLVKHLKEGLYSFFQDADEDHGGSDEGSETSPTSSSSPATASRPMPSIG